MNHTTQNKLETIRIGNEHLYLDFLARSGPRIVRLSPAGSEANLMAELPDLKIDTPFGPYSLHGGHRLWHSPEAMPRSYIPDDEGLLVERTAQGARLVGAKEEATGIRKSIEIQLSANKPALKIIHTLENEGIWPVELAPWAITQLPLGGLAVFPQQTGALDETGLLPNRQLVLWPYTRWQDPRLHLSDEVILIDAQAELPPVKIGYFNRQGWIAYWLGKNLLIKRFDPQPELPHADFGCNAESYCNNRFIELETLGPLARLEPGQKTSHEERWELHSGVERPENIQAVYPFILSHWID